jgi:hypothetical protein
MKKIECYKKGSDCGFRILSARESYLELSEESSKITLNIEGRQPAEMIKQKTDSERLPESVRYDPCQYIISFYSGFFSPETASSFPTSNFDLISLMK